MNRQKVKLLGPVLVTWEEAEPPRFRSQRTLALLGYLVAERRPVARDALAALFWPDEDSSTGKANLRRELHNLGNILPGCWEIDRKRVRFAPGAGTEVDVYALRQREQAEQWVEAAELVEGKFLEGVYLDGNLEFETWLLGERERWDQRAERVLRQAVQEKIRSGDAAGALHFGRRLLQLLPWHEGMHRQVMVLLAQQGQRTAALRQYEHCKAVLQEELGVEVAAETRALYERIRDSSTFTLHNIPAATAPLIGREQELATLNRWLEDGKERLITITGAGGMGKTRLALGLAQQLLEQPALPFSDGLYLVSLAALQDPEQLTSSIGDALKFSFHNRDRRSPRQQLLDYLQGKQMLLLLDNFEHLLPGAELVAAIAKAAPDVQIVATSRERLRLRGEQVLPLRGLTYDHETASQVVDGAPSAAARLFLAVAERVRPGFDVEQEGTQLRRICRLVEGMPLALELAATWVDTLSLTAIGDEIEQGVSFLETDLRNLPQRHRSMCAVFDKSWRRMSSQEQEVFARLSIFRGGFTREAAAMVAATTPRILARLVRRSLLNYEPHADRYELHELLRQYAAGRLAPADMASLHASHLQFFADFAAQVQPWQPGPGAETNLSRLKKELGNFQLALEWSLGDPLSARLGLKLAVELENFWTLAGHVDEGHRWLSRLLAGPASGSEPAVKARALRTAAMLEFYYTGDRQKSIRLYEESLAIQEAIGDREGRTKTLCSLAGMHMKYGNAKKAAVHWEKALQLARESEYMWGICSALEGLGLVALFHDRWDAARSFFERGLPLARENGDLPRIADFHAGLGLAAMAEQQWDRARLWLEEALKLFRAAESEYGIVGVLRFLGDVARAEGHYQRAEEYYKEGLALKRRSGAIADSGLFLSALGQTALLLGQVDQALAYLRECLHLGQRIDGYELIFFALDGFANVASAQAEPARAATLWGAAEAASRHLGSKLTVPDQLAHDHFVALAQKQTTESAFAAAWAEGREMAVEEAVAYARAGESGSVDDGDSHRLSTLSTEPSKASKG